MRKLGSSYLGENEDSDLGGKQDGSSVKFGLDGAEDGITPKNFPVCDNRHSELIPCPDRHLIYHTRLKLDLSLMEHYERHCPSPERRSQSNDQKVDTKFGKRTFLTLTSHMRSLTRIGWLLKEIGLTFLEEALTSIMERTSNSFNGEYQFMAIDIQEWTTRDWE